MTHRAGNWQFYSRPNSKQTPVHHMISNCGVTPCLAAISFPLFAVLLSRAQAYPHRALQWLGTGPTLQCNVLVLTLFQPCTLNAEVSRSLQMGSILPANAPTLSAAANAPLGLTSFALSLLLVFRTNTSYARWAEAREIWGGVTNRSRDILRQVWRQELPCMPDCESVAS